MTLDQLAEEAVDAVIRRLRRDPCHRANFSTEEAEHIRELFAETQNVALTARQMRMSQHHVRKALSGK